MGNSVEKVMSALGVDDERFIEIESKRRVLPEEADAVRKFLLHRKDVGHEGERVFFDQFIDTAGMDIFRSGASLRVRYKGNGSRIYLQYKGPGFRREGVLYRSEFRSDRLTNVLLEESHHDIVHFTGTSIREILARHVPPEMRRAMILHLGSGVVRRINCGPIICVYHKDKFILDLDSAFLEPSLDQVFAFHISKNGIHPLSAFCEYENEIKAPRESLSGKMEHIRDMLAFDKDLIRRFDMPPEPLDKYHRCASFFIP